MHRYIHAHILRGLTACIHICLSTWATRQSLKTPGQEKLCLFDAQLWFISHLCWADISYSFCFKSSLYGLINSLNTASTLGTSATMTCDFVLTWRSTAPISSTWFQSQGLNHSVVWFKGICLPKATTSRCHLLEVGDQVLWPEIEWSKHTVKLDFKFSFPLVD